MAEKKTNEAAREVPAPAAAPDPEELVEYTAPMLYTDRERDIVVAVNGETIRIMRGVPVKIKRKFLEVLENARLQEAATRQAIEDAKKQSETALANF